MTNSFVQIDKYLSEASWYSGRSVLVPNLLENEGIEIFPVAQAVLEEFYGLHISGASKGGDFQPSRLDFFPQDTDFLREDTEMLSNYFRKKFFPMADIDSGHGTLLILSLIHI